ncbi:SUF system Fe-S cluster assembly regulator [Methylococcus sp. EFPC2]|uniref:SUF system Fe-S cluster assembly regulator n=1 Tax=Methylococcus sp. EFPC2 TaxID=2812648 RepID=UPI0019677C66|nr:SUF system Fe-S cluster assembly regulator [Methylococcus sp. EFPC2]QSA95649.1 SUF system Fe-S cluster assembly regulator [Methylococcus sp. EFPC2]
MLRISKLTDYAVIVLAQMAKCGEGAHTACGLAEATGVAAPTVSKILKMLSRAGVVKSTRGAKGGYSLVRLPEQTSVASVIYALEGPIALTECEGERGGCEQSSSCHARGSWEVINRAVRKALESVSLADMAKVPAMAGPAEVNIPVSTLFQSRQA